MLDTWRLLKIIRGDGGFELYYINNFGLDYNNLTRDVGMIFVIYHSSN